MKVDKKALSISVGVLSLLFYAAISPTAFSATGGAFRTYLKANTNEVAPNSEFTVKVLIDAPQPINALEMEINYSPKVLQFVSSNNSNSIIDFWHGDPGFQPPGIIHLEGGSIDSFSGTSGEVITLKFRAKSGGSANLSFGRADLYQADGKGTLARADASQSLKISIVEGAATPSELAAEVNDKNPPIIETARAVSSPVDNSRIAVYQTKDSESGIKSTEIRFRQELSWSEWQRAANPTRLPLTAWAYQLRVTDNANNTAEETVYVPEPILKLILPLLPAVLLLGILAYILFRKRRARAE